MPKPSRLLFVALTTILSIPLTAGCADSFGSSDAGGAETVPLDPAAVPEVDLRLDRHLLRFEPGRSGVRERVRAAARRLGGEIEAWYPDVGVGTVRGLGDGDLPELLAVDGMLGGARDVPVRLLDASDTAQLASGPGVRPSDHDGSGEASLRGRQWHLDAIAAPEAWHAGRDGASEVTVAILDTGIDYEHADLRGRVDLARSASFLPSDDELVRRYFPERHPVTDLHYHGTHVAATVSSNGVAAAGVTRDMTLIGVKVLGVDGRGSFASVVYGLLHATEAGADVINMSLGMTLSEKDPRSRWRVALMHYVLAYVYLRGTTVVVAAGNDARDLDQNDGLFTAYCEAPTVLCVSATGPVAADGPAGPFHEVDAFAPYSNFGRSAVDVAAPGGAAAPVWAACSSTSLWVPTCQDTSRAWALGLIGTSMATPHAAGLAALVVGGGARRPAHVMGAIEGSALDLGPPGLDPQYGHGRIDVPAALR